MRPAEGQPLGNPRCAAVARNSGAFGRFVSLCGTASLPRSGLMRLRQARRQSFFLGGTPTGHAGKWFACSTRINSWGFPMNRGDVAAYEAMPPIACR